MTNLLVTWLLSAVSLLIVAYFIKGFDISGFGSALIAAVVIGLANGTIGFFLTRRSRNQTGLAMISEWALNS
jgi:putative membrane protein